ncbi:MAG: 30S ribosomal protein S17 [Clostridia bacterium]
MERNARKVKVGKVVSNKMDKTIVVRVDTKVKVPLYGKIINKSLKIKAHDEENTCDIGDKVEIMETKPISRDKRYRLVKIVDKVK